MSTEGVVGESAMTLSFSRGQIGDYQAGWRALIEGMADKEDEVAAKFLELTKEHDFPDIRHATAKLTEKVIGEQIQSRDYYVIEKPYPNGGKSTLAVRAAPYGKDLYVEWLQYELGIINWPLIIIAGVVGTAATCGIGLLLFVPGFAWAVLAGYLRRDLTHFEKQDSWALRAGVDTCLKQAIDRVGISKELVHEIPEGQTITKRRLI